MNETKKTINVLWIYDYLLTHRKITTKIIIDNLIINERQRWRYMSDIKMYINTYTKYRLAYSKKTKEYLLEEK